VYTYKVKSWFSQQRPTGNLQTLYCSTQDRQGNKNYGSSKFPLGGCKSVSGLRPISVCFYTGHFAMVLLNLTISTLFATFLSLNFSSIYITACYDVKRGRWALTFLRKEKQKTVHKKLFNFYSLFVASVNVPHLSLLENNAWTRMRFTSC